MSNRKPHYDEIEKVWIPAGARTELRIDFDASEVREYNKKGPKYLKMFGEKVLGKVVIMAKEIVNAEIPSPFYHQEEPETQSGLWKEFTLSVVNVCDTPQGVDYYVAGKSPLVVRPDF